MTRRLLPFLAAAGPIAMVGLAALAPATSGAPLQRMDASGRAIRADAREDVEPALVVVDAVGTQFGAAGWTAKGNGVIIDPSGLVLTNAHVAQPDAPGLAATWANPFITATATTITVTMGATLGGTPQQFTATPVAVDGYLDVAILRLTATSAGIPVDPVTTVLPALTLGVTTGVAVGTPVTFATIADAGSLVDTPTGGYWEQTGMVTELVSFTNVTTGPAAFATSLGSATMYSGGAALDSAGSLMGLPTWHPGSAPTTVNIIRADLITPLLTAARAGTAYTSPYTVIGTGLETLTFSRWGPDVQTTCAQPPPAPITSYPAGATSVTGGFVYDQFTDGEDLFVVWYDPVLRQLISSSILRWNGGTTGECYPVGISRSDGLALAEGAYAVQVYAGPNLNFEAMAETTLGQSTTGTVTVSGRVVNADTAQPIAGATLYVLDQGVDVQTWFSAPIQDQIAAQGTTADGGSYSTAPPLVPGVYPFVLSAPGFIPAGGMLDLSEGGFLSDLQLVAAE